MSYRMTTLNAYDVMDSVHIIVGVRATTEDRTETIETELRYTTTLPSIGEDDPREWLRDVLVAALECL